MNWLKTESTQLTFEDLRKGVQGQWSLHEKSTIDFCHHWLNGKSRFEFSTSGSSGEPKKIQFTREQLESSARMTAQVLGLRNGYTSLVCLDTHYIAGAMMLVRSLVTGMNMIVRTPSANPLDGIDDTVDFAAFVPYQLAGMFEQSIDSLNKLKVIIIGGAPVTDHMEEMARNLAPAVFATYGMTETASHVALRKLNGPDRQAWFQMLPGMSAAVDPRGCLVLTVPSLGIKSLVTNDRVDLLDEQRFHWRGRYDRVINSGGIKIQAEAVERIVEVVFSELRIENRFFIAGMPDEKLGERVVLILEGAMRPHEEQRMMNHVRARLEKYHEPRAVHFVSRFEQTVTQKIDRLETIRKLQEGEPPPSPTSEREK